MNNWHEFLAQQGAVLDDTRVAYFGDAQAELQATASGNIITDLLHLGLLEVGGEDAATFLQGQVTSDIKALNNSSQYAGYCTPKGRLLAIFLAFAHYDHIHLQINGALKDAIMKRLKMYVMRSKVTITDVSDSIIRMAVAGVDTSAALTEVFGEIPETPHQMVSLDNGAILRLPGNTPRYQVFSTPEQAPAIWKALSQTCKPVGSECWEWLEIQAGIPDITPATQEQFVPQMVNLDLIGGISFKKGCYTGQEIVARTHYLGKVKRRTHLAHVDTTTAPQAGDLLYGDGEEAVGIVVRAAAAAEGGFDVLAEVRLESAEAGTIKLINHVALQLKPLPYAFHQ
ncbi:MAG: YgfZ/GcvT domain-containing protein [Methylophilaceae bacterium]